jgi:Phosphoenolpyruvate phosphomutase
MAVTQFDKGNSFRALHQGPRSFIITNAWDAGSARILAGVGFAALATSSGAAAGKARRVEAEKRDGRTRPRRDASTCKIEPDTFERKEGNSHVRRNIAEDAGF